VIEVFLLLNSFQPGLERPEPFYFFFRSRSILKNWNEAGVGAGIN